MEIRKEFEAEGWEVRYMRTKVKVYHPKHGEFNVCSKYYGGGGYEEELTNAFTYLKTKGLMKSSTKKFVRIGLSHPGYCVPADRQDMIDTAVDALYDDVMGAVKHNEIDEWIDIVDANATEKDIPSFITEICDNEEVDVLDMEATYCEGCGVLCIADLCTDCLHKEESFPCNECDCEYGDGSCSDCIEIQRAEGRYEELWGKDNARPFPVMRKDDDDA